MPESRLTPHTLQRLCVALALTTAATAVVGIASQVWMRTVLARGDRLAPRLLEDVVRAGQAKVAVERMTVAGRGYLEDGSSELLARARATETKLDLALEVMRASAPTAEEGGGLGRLPAALQRYRELFESIVVARSAGNDRETARAVMRDRLMPARDEAEAELDALMVRRRERLAAMRARRHDVVARAFRTTAAVGLLGAMAGALCAWLAAAPAPPRPRRRARC
jgi:CHASE3 domain sensor protein